MNDMIERVARALCTHHYEKIVGGSIAKHIHMLCNVEQNWPRFVDAAKVAIEAMREPTEPMISEGADTAIGQIYCGASGAKAVWRNMIDAALKPETIERSER